MKNVFALFVFAILLSVPVFGQVTLPPVSQKQEIAQTIGDTMIKIVYHRPTVQSRKIWDGLVPFGEVWRSGANAATVFEVSKDVTINGKALPAGKYSLHTIPTATDWTVILNKDDGQWGSFSYDAAKDAVRATSTPIKSTFAEAVTYSFVNPKADSVDVHLAWENLAVPFTVGIGDIHGRMLAQIREALPVAAADKKTPLLNQFAGYVASFKLKQHLAEAMTNIDASIATRETFGNLSTKARLLAEQGKVAEAITTGEKAIATGQAATPPANPNAVANFQKTVNEWKTKK